MIVHDSNVLKFNGFWLGFGSSPTPPSPDPYNPLNLPPFTIRVKYKAGVTPTLNASNATKVQVSSEPNIWDITYQSSIWTGLFRLAHLDEPAYDDMLEVLGANTEGVTGLSHLFWKCTSLTKVALFDTRATTSIQSMFRDCSALVDVPEFHFDNVTNAYHTFMNCSSLVSVPKFTFGSVKYLEEFFAGCASLISMPIFDDISTVTSIERICADCSSLTSIPLLNVPNVTRSLGAFKNCVNVANGSLAMYNYLANKDVQVTYHAQTFMNCGTNTTTGAAELRQIPLDWKQSTY